MKMKLNFAIQPFYNSPKNQYYGNNKPRTENYSKFKLDNNFFRKQISILDKNKSQIKDKSTLIKFHKN